jgi:hypothetical protein
MSAPYTTHKSSFVPHSLVGLLQGGIHSVAERKEVFVESYGQKPQTKRIESSLILIY